MEYGKLEQKRAREFRCVGWWVSFIFFYISWELYLSCSLRFRFSRDGSRKPEVGMVSLQEILYVWIASRAVIKNVSLAGSRFVCFHFIFHFIDFIAYCMMPFFFPGDLIHFYTCERTDDERAPIDGGCN